MIWYQKLSVILAVAILGSLPLVPQQVAAHCQIPCGIYDDNARVQSMLEDAETVKKSIRLINELAGNVEPQAQNQLVRWVMNKEQHAQKVIDTVSDYFLTQRVKPEQEDYRERLVKHHRVIIAAMKAKQNSESSYASALEEAIAALLDYYPPHEH